jgi:hypothetical protein
MATLGLKTGVAPLKLLSSKFLKSPQYGRKGKERGGSRTERREREGEEGKRRRGKERAAERTNIFT